LAELTSFEVIAKEAKFDQLIGSGINGNVDFWNGLIKGFGPHGGFLVRFIGQLNGEIVPR